MHAGDAEVGFGGVYAKGDCNGNENDELRVENMREGEKERTATYVPTKVNENSTLSLTFFNTWSKTASQS